MRCYGHIGIAWRRAPSSLGVPIVNVKCLGGWSQCLPLYHLWNSVSFGSDMLGLFSRDAVWPCMLIITGIMGVVDPHAS